MGITRLGKWRKQEQGLYQKAIGPPLAIRIGLLWSSALQTDGRIKPMILQCRTPQETNPKGHWGPNYFFIKSLFLLPPCTQSWYTQHWTKRQRQHPHNYNRHARGLRAGWRRPHGEGRCLGGKKDIPTQTQCKCKPPHTHTHTHTHTHSQARTHARTHAGTHCEHECEAAMFSLTLS